MGVQTIATVPKLESVSDNEYSSSSDEECTSDSSDSEDEMMSMYSVSDDESMCIDGPSLQEPESDNEW